MTEIQLRAISKRYQQTRALEGLDLTIREGECLTLLGPSGSGKTTLLNVLQGFETPDAGDVMVDGIPITHDRPNQRGFGMVFQSYALFPNMTVAENIGYPLRLRGHGGSDRREMVNRALERIRLTEKADSFPAQLSGGQQQRVALARAIVYDPPVLLMDEPLSALDRQLRQALQLELKALHQQLSCTIVYVTHDQEEALVLSDRIAVMNEGQIVQCAPAQEIYRQPKTKFVASFLGEANFFDAKVAVDNSNRAEVRIPEIERSLALGTQDLPEGADDLVACVRPEAVAVHSANSSGGVEAEVVQTVYLGDSWRLKARVPSGREVVAKVPGRDLSEPMRDGQIVMKIEPGDITLLPAA